MTEHRLTTETASSPKHSVAARISQAMVHLTSQYLGRGPTMARTTLNTNFALVVLEDSLTKAERNLVAAGELESVRGQRRTFQALMREEAIRAVEEATGRQVRTFLGDFSAEAGIAAELFLFEPSSDTGDATVEEAEVRGDAE